MTHRDYTKQKIKVFACYKNKQPSTPNGFYDATDNNEILYYQFTKEAFLIGLPTGAFNHIAVIDFDLYKDVRSIEEIKAGIEFDFPETLNVQTQSGGLHYYYKIYPERGHIPNLTKAFGDNVPIDIRGDGGYIIAPDGVLYHPVDVEIEDLKENFWQYLADAPDWLYNYKKPQSEAINFIDSISDNEYKNLESALSVLASDDRDRWVNFGIALKNTGSGRAYELWDKWSRKSYKYNEDDQSEKWATFKPSGDITIASIFQLAQKSGWDFPDQQVSTINLEEIDERKNHEKIPFPKELLNPPGLIGEIIEHINRFSKKKQPILALAASFAASGAIMGQRFQTDQGLRTNLYILGVGDSSSGKEAARAAIKKLFEASGVGDMAGTEDLASDAAILTTIEKTPSQLFLLDEIGRFLKTTNQAGSKNAHLYNVISVLLKIYGSANQTYRGKAYADIEKQKVIESPNLCIYGTTVPSTLFEGLNVENITDGFLSRFMIFESEDPNPKPSGRKRMATTAVSENLVKKIREIIAMPKNYQVAGNLDKSVNPLVVPMTPEAETLLNEYEELIYAKREELRKVDRINVIYGRTPQFAEQISLILAVGRNHKEPCIDTSDVNYAIKLVNYLSDRVHHISEHFIARNEHEHESKRVLNIIRTAGKRGITSSNLTRKTQNLKQHDRAGILDMLEESGQIKIAMDGRTKYYYPLKIKHEVF